MWFESRQMARHGVDAPLGPLPAPAPNANLRGAEAKRARSVPGRAPIAGRRWTAPDSLMIWCILSFLKTFRQVGQRGQSFPITAPRRSIPFPLYFQPRCSGTTSPGSPRRTAAKRPEMRSAAARRGSLDRWAYRCVVLTSEWPNSEPINNKLSPMAAAVDANPCRKS